MSSKYVFVPQSKLNLDGRKHIRSRVACEPCRNKKRRCDHQHREASSTIKPAVIPKRIPTSALDITQDVCEIDDDIEDGPAVEQATTVTQRSEKSKGDDELSRHTPDSGPGPTSGSALDVSSVPETASIQSSVHPPQIYSIRRTFTSASPLVDAGSSTPRFVSDLNPEARLLDAENYCEQPQNQSPEIVGIWVQPQPGLGSVQNDFQQDSPWRNHTSSEVGGAADSDVLAFDTIVKLSDIYFDNIQPILPLLNEQDANV
ncbi:hypothetical protein CGCF413_v013168 [Colletotrichum fructicola]|nr:hypothetical protein CGCF413_v013168 [Colletotrichum fructicola]